MTSERPGSPTKQVLELFGEYVARRQRGDIVDVVDYERRLITEVQRTQLKDLIARHNADTQVSVSTQTGDLLAGRYEILGQLGAGGMGRVLRAHDKKNDCAVAVKVLQVSGSAMEADALLRRERQALVRLRHPHIVNFFDADHWRGCFYIVMECVDGKSIGEVVLEIRRKSDVEDPAWRRDASPLRAAIAKPVQKGRQDLLLGRSYDEAVAAIVAACASALECAHSANVVHRDLKPGNVLLTGGGNPVVLDFGLSTLADATRGPLSNMLAGTPNYIPPEHVRAGKIGADPRADIYQLGAVLYEMLTLERPYGDAPADQVVEAVAHRTLPRPRSVESAIPLELECICLKAMARDVGKRYQMATELRTDLERFLGKKVLPEAAKADAPLWLRARYFVRRHAWPILVVIITAGALVLLLRP